MEFDECSQCSNNLKQLGLALHNYADGQQRFPPGTDATTAWTFGTLKGSVLVKLLPFVEQSPLYGRLDFRLNVEDQLRTAGYGHNWVNWSAPDLPQNDLPIWRCPTDDYNHAHISDSNYAPSIGAQQMDALDGCQRYFFPGGYFGTGPAGHGNSDDPGQLSGVFGRLSWAAAFRDITDGTANTIAMGEIRGNCGDHTVNGAHHYNSLWIATTAPINFPTCPMQPLAGSGVCYSTNTWQTSQGFKSRHPGGAQFVFADGSTRFLSETIEYETYQRLGDRRDGRPVGSF